MPKKSRKTRQKEEIEAAIGGFGRFFSAEELHAMVKGKNKRIGLATVYRSLKSLDRQGKVHRYLCGRRRLYSKESDNHCHFICYRCGSTKHFDLKKIDFIEVRGIGQACHFQLDVHGVCRKCVENAAKAKD